MLAIANIIKANPNHTCKSTISVLLLSFPVKYLINKGIVVPTVRINENILSLVSKGFFIKRKINLDSMVGETGLEPAASASQTQRSSQLNYSPKQQILPQ